MGVIRLCLYFLSLNIAAIEVTTEEWWEYGNFYQIYLPSFQDSNGDGIGDLNGLTQRLPYLKFLDVTGIILSPIFQSPMKRFGYDTSDYRAIQSEYGTMDDFDRLLARCNDFGIKLILDFIPNHSSDQHFWFQKSSNPNDSEFQTYKDYYIWNSGKVLEHGKREPPSNWLSQLGGSAWNWSEGRQQYFYHQFSDSEPDLNYRNKKVRDEINGIQEFWLNKGVAGFRYIAVSYLFEMKEDKEGSFMNEPLSGKCIDDPKAYCHLNHIHTVDLDETFNLIYQWRRLIQKFAIPERILLTEGYTTLKNNLRFYGKQRNGTFIEYGSQIPINFNLLTINVNDTACDFKRSIDEWIHLMPNGTKIHPNWIVGNHDQSRIASKYGTYKVDLMNILIKTLPGITITYYGEEIGMTDVFVTWNGPTETGRAPFQWDGSKNAGFSTADETWLPIASNYTINNLLLQKIAFSSHFKVFRKLSFLRQNPTMKYGELDIKTVECDLLVYKREISNNRRLTDVFVIILNFTPNYKTISLHDSFSGLPREMFIAVSSFQSKTNYIGTIVNTSNITVEPDIGIVLLGKKLV